LAVADLRFYASATLIDEIGMGADALLILEIVLWFFHKRS
jgi:hypothetical protein